MNPTDLKPCPMCRKNTAVIRKACTTWWNKPWYVYCQYCLCYISGSYTKRVAISEWNRRANDADGVGMDNH